MNSKDKKQYEAPSLTAVSFKTEQGFAISMVSLMPDSPEYDYQQIEDYTTHSGWNSEDNHFWD